MSCIGIIIKYWGSQSDYKSIKKPWIPQSKNIVKNITRNKNKTKIQDFGNEKID